MVGIVASTHALRALLRASTGDRLGAEADIEAVQKSPFADPEALARAALAGAVLPFHRDPTQVEVARCKVGGFDDPRR